MKIGFVYDDSIDNTDGVTQYILTLGAWLASQGHDIHYLVGQTSRTDIPNVHSLARNVKVRFNGNRMSIPLPANRQAIRRVLANGQFDVLHVQVPYSPLLAGRVLQLADTSTNIVGTFHVAPHSWLMTIGTRLLALVSRRSLKHLRLLVSNSTAARAFASQTYRKSSQIIPNPVTVSSFANAEPMLLPSSLPSVIFLGRLVPRKGCQILLQAVAELQKRSPDLRFQTIICGRGPLEQQLQSFAAAQNLQNITFAGFVSEADKARYLKTADVAVFPSTGGESFGIVLLEAMAAGHPVVLGADNAGYASVLQPYPAALFRANDSAALAAALRAVLTSGEARQSAIDWQRSYIGQYDVATVGGQLLKIYRKV